MTSILPDIPIGDPRRTFGALLEAHLKRGTRPTGRKVWTYSEFAASQRLDVTERRVFLWRRGQAPSPAKFKRILELLFGEPPVAAHAKDAEELISAYHRLKSKDRRQANYSLGNITVAAFGSGPGSEDPDRIPVDAWNCYETLFPIAAERDDPVNITSWLKQAQLPDHEWVELFFTCSADDVCVGMAFLSLYQPRKERGQRPSGWWFGNYFGILNGWRDFGIAGQFLTGISRHCEQVVPGAKGILFEVERYSDSEIKSVLAKLRSISHPRYLKGLLTKSEKENVRAARRIALYTGRGVQRLPPNIAGNPSFATSPMALSVVTKSDSGGYTFVEYAQPAMQMPLGRANEVDLWLMVYPLKGFPAPLKRGLAYALSEQEVKEMFEFIYGEVFPSAYMREHDSGAAADSSIAGYSEYLKKFRHRIEAPLAGRNLFLVDATMISPPVRELLLHFRDALDKLGLNI